MTKKYATVNIPITGYVTVDVEVEDGEDPIDKAMNSEISTDDIADWNTTEAVVKGSVCYADLWYAEVVEEWEE